jgi:hypothetical protein
LLLPIVGVAVEYFLVPRTYQSAASLWALQRYAVIGATGLESDLQSTPAQTQTTALTELLQTRSFVLTVVKGIDLAPTLGFSESAMPDPQQLQDALFNEISKKVLVTSQGYNLFEISYTNRNPQVAQQVIQSVIENYGLQSVGLSVAEGQNLLESYQTQLQNAQQDENTIVAAEAQYIAAHPELTPNKLPSDPQYALLQARVVQAETNVQNIQNTINTIQQSISSSANTLYKVIDAPQIPIHSTSRTKNYLIGGGVGLAVGLLACSIFLIILVRRDQALYTASDLQSVVEIPVVMQLPVLTGEMISMLTTRPVSEGILLVERKSRANGKPAG